MTKERVIVWKCLECDKEFRHKLPMELSDSQCPHCQAWNPEVDFVRIEMEPHCGKLIDIWWEISSG